MQVIVLTPQNLEEVGELIRKMFSDKNEIYFKEVPITEIDDTNIPQEGKFLKLYFNENESVVVGNRIVSRIHPQYIAIKDKNMCLFEVGLDIGDKIIMYDEKIIAIKEKPLLKLKPYSVVIQTMAA